MGRVLRRPKTTPLRKESRTRPLKGKGADENVYYRCWNCGFICDVTRDKLGGPDDVAGDNHTTGYEAAGVRPYGKDSHLYVGVEQQCCLGGSIGHYHTVMKLGPDGTTPVTVVHNLKSDVSFGCPSCGTTNWRGDY